MTRGPDQTFTTLDIRINYLRPITVGTGEVTATGNVIQSGRKIAYVDLMKIKDPDKKARKPLNDGVLTFPFFTIENVDRVDETHIIVGNDNNLPFSSGRALGKSDDNELILLKVTDLLNAK